MIFLGFVQTVLACKKHQELEIRSLVVLINAMIEREERIEGSEKNKKT